LAVSQQTLLERLVPNPSRMQEILMANAAPLMSELVMLELAKTIGRQRAHDLVHEAITSSLDSGTSFANTLFKHEIVRTHYEELQALEAALNPLRYTGQSRQVALEMAASARASAKRLRSAFNEEVAL